MGPVPHRRDRFGAPPAPVDSGFRTYFFPSADTGRMKRRALLSVAVAAAVGGCLGDAGGRTETNGDTSTHTTPATATTDGSVTITVADGSEERTLVTGEDIATVGDVAQARQSGYRVPVTLTDEGTSDFATGLERIGAFDDPSAHEIRTYLDGERLTTATLAPNLAAEIESGEWDGSFIVHVSERAEAERLHDALAGA